MKAPRAALLLPLAAAVGFHAINRALIAALQWNSLAATDRLRQVASGLCSDASVSALLAAAALAGALGGAAGGGPGGPPPPLRRALRGLPALATVFCAAALFFVMANTVKVAFTGSNISPYDFSLLREAVWATDSVRKIYSAPLAWAATAAFLLAYAALVALFDRALGRARKALGHVSRRAAAVTLGALVALVILGHRSRLALSLTVDEPMETHVVPFFQRRLQLDAVLRIPRPDAAIARLDRQLRALGAEPAGDPERPTLNRRPARPPADGAPVLGRGTNLVLVLLEGHGMKTILGRPEIAPFLTGLGARGIALERHYTSVFRTCGAQLSALCSLADPPGFFVSREYPRLTLHCLPRLLREQGYATLWVTGSPAGFDNNAYWLRTNGFERVVAKDDFPETAPRFSFGVHDEAMFDRLVDEIDRLPRPFFAYGLTMSNHHPYVAPAGFLDRHPEAAPWSDVEKLYRYVDEQIERFMARAAQRPWYRDTLFAFFGDHPHWGEHGQGAPDALSSVLARFHTAAVLFHPAMTPRRISERTSHLDIAPTLAGLLGLSVESDFLGRDVLGPAPAPAFIASQPDERNSYFVLHGEERAFLFRPAGGCEAVERGAERARPCRPEESAEARAQGEELYDPLQWEVVERAMGGATP